MNIEIDKKIALQYARYLKDDYYPDNKKANRLIKKAYNKVLGIKTRKLTKYNEFVKEQMTMLCYNELQKEEKSERLKPQELMKIIAVLWKMKKEEEE